MQPGTGASAAYLTVLAAVVYSTFLLGPLLNPELSAVNGYVSELAAVNQPYGRLFRTGDLIAGACAVTVSVRCLARQRRARAGWAFLLLFGVCAIADALLPLDCAPSLETWCALREAAGQVSPSHRLHAVTSSLVILFGVLALLTLSLAARRNGWWPPLARWGAALAAAEALCGTATLVLMVHGRWLGLMQRVQIGILCAGLLVIAWALHGNRTARRTRSIPVREGGEA